MGRVVRTVEICNARGLHARASAKLVKLASGFQSEVTVSREGQSVDARSIMGLLMLSAGQGCAIEIAAALQVSPNTVRNQVATLRGKFGAASRQELVHLAQEAGLL